VRHGTRTHQRSLRDRIVRVAVYLRVSSAKQVKGYGLDTQEDSCHSVLDYKIGKGLYVIVDTYTDEGVSGKLASRPQFDRLNADVAAGLIDVVVIAKLDRVGRTMEDIHQWVFDTTKAGVRVITADNRIDSEDEMFKLQLSILAYMADVEHMLILERTTSGRERKMAAGGWAFGVPPFGLKLEGKARTATPVLNDKEIDTIVKAIEFIVDQGDRITTAREKLNTAGYLTRSGKPWHDSGLKRMLHNTSLDGFIMVRDPERNDGRSNAIRDEEGNFLYGDTVRIPVPTSDRLPESRIKAVRAALARRYKQRSSPLQTYILSGRLIGLCGKHYVGANREKQGRGRMYICSGNKDVVGGNADKCGCMEIYANEVEALVWESVSEGLQDRKHLESLAAEWLGSVPARITSYKEHIASLEQQLERKKKSRRTKILTLLSVIDEDDEGGISQDEIDDLKSELRNQEKKLEEDLASTRKWLAEAEQQEQRVADVMALAENMNPRLNDIADQQKRDVIALFDIKAYVAAEPESRMPVPTVFESWFKSHEAPVPAPLTDEQWAVVEPLAPDRTSGRGAYRWVSRRILLDAIFFKVRNGLAWAEMPEGPYGSGASLKNIAARLMADGTFEAAMRLLGDYEGTPLPSLVRLPDLDIRASFDSASDDLGEYDDDLEAAGSIGTPHAGVLFAELHSRTLIAVAA
jgi:DNA invertase Pin-like site-specific DNA recombinase